MWISQPTDEHRRAAHAAAEAAQFSTPAGCAGLAAFFSGGSLAPPDSPAVPPGEFLTAKAVSGAVIFAAVSNEPAKAPEKFKQFLAQGLDVTVRLKLWR
ncbi:Putative secreted protein (fragment) [Candidatus Sulfopaludibacter sp. SbA3]